MSGPGAVIAIDGPAASGKSSVARVLAGKLDYLYVNTGAMYRALTWYMLEQGVTPADSAAVISQLRKVDFGIEIRQGATVLAVNGRDPEPHLSEEGVNQNVSAFSSVPEVRQFLVERQREFGEHSGIVMEGRDIGTVVFPETPFKFYIDASPEIRAQRRKMQGMKDEIAKRDRFDSSRRDSPLSVASDAVTIDSSTMSIEEVVGEILNQLRAKGLEIPANVR